jgi:NAD(P)-dependent dehydrogenase (short-subunit alcohol dehydrogenase family)
MREPMNRFAGKVAIVTGGASGIGAATARRFAAEGARVVVADVQDDLGRELARELTSMTETVYVHCDVASLADWTALAHDAIDRFGRLDIVHNNAYSSVTKPAHELEEADWNRTLDVCVKQVFLSAKACIEHLLQTHGVIINTSSVHALVSFRGYAAYDAAKAAICALTRNLAVEYGPAVRVNAVLPGAILTPSWRGTTEEYREEFVKQIVAQRLGRVEEVASAVCFLASADASYITGVSLVVDGGFTITKDQSLGSSGIQ